MAQDNLNKDKTINSVMYIDGIASSRALDSSGEIVDIEGLDCSTLIGGAINFEHESKTPDQLLGKILEYKKIFKEEDCENDRHKFYWNKIKLPFLYILGRLFSDKKRSSQEIAALFLDDAQNPNEKPMLGFSIEGVKLDKALNNPNIVSRSIARKVTVTVLPCNKTCIAQMVPLQNEKEQDPLDNIFKSENQPAEIYLKPGKNDELFELLKKEHESMEKAAKLSLVPKEPSNSPVPPKMEGTHLGNTSSGKAVFSHGKVGEYEGFGSKEHKEAAEMHQKASQIPGNPKLAAHHNDKMKLHNQAAKTAEFKEGRFQRGKDAIRQKMKNAGMKKAMTAGSGMAAPSSLTGGAALAKENLMGTNPKQDAKYKDASAMNPQTSKVAGGMMGGVGMGRMGGMGRRMEGVGGVMVMSEKDVKKSDELNKPLGSKIPGNKTTPSSKAQMGMSSMGQKVRHGRAAETISTAKETAQKQLSNIKKQPKPNLGKSDELNKPVFNKIPGDKMRSGLPGIKEGMGTSHMGAHVRRNTEHNTDRAKEIAQKQLSNLKKQPKPSLGKSENKHLNRAKEEYKKWAKKEAFEDFMSKKMPHLTKGEVSAIGQALCLSKSLKQESVLKNLSKPKK